MAAKKDQHYVPQFLMKNFSCFGSRKVIGVYNLGSKIFLNCKSAIKGQSQEDYFYGKDFSMENMLGNLEGLVGGIFKKIITTNKLPEWGTEEYAYMHIFTMIQANRTKYSEEEYNEFFDMHFKNIYKHHPEYSKILDSIQFGIKDAPTQVLQHTFDSMDVTYDLECKLIINESEIPFILSDHPAVKYNQFLKERRINNGTCGFSSLGLQIFLPISPRHMLLFFDQDTYKVGCKNYNFVRINSSIGAETFNELQFLNCNENIYFNEHFKESSVIKMNKKHLRHRRLGKNDFKEYEVQSNEERYITMISGQEINFPFKITICSFTKAAKAYVLGNRFAHMRPYSKMKRKELDNINQSLT